MLHTNEPSVDKRLIIILLAENSQVFVDRYVLNAGRIHSVRIDNNTFERVEEFKYLGTTLRNQNSIPEEIKSRLRSGSTCYHLVQNFLSSRLLFKNYRSRYI